MNNEKLKLSISYTLNYDIKENVSDYLSNKN